MSLKITHATDPITVNTITLCIYSVPGVGKTSTAFTSDDCLLLDFDRRVHASRNRGASSPVSTWSDVTKISADDLAPYKTVAIDTVGRALDVLSLDIMASDARMARGGALTLQGFGRLKAEFLGWLRMIRSFGKDVVMLCHSDEQKSGDDLLERLDVQGGSKNEIYKSADVMGRLYMQGGKRWLNFSPTDTSFGKNPAGMPPLQVPDFAKEPRWLAGIVAQIKAAINAATAAQAEAAQTLTEWQAVCDAANDGPSFLALVETVKTAAPSIREACQAILTARVKASGWKYSKTAGAFERVLP